MALHWKYVVIVWILAFIPVPFVIMAGLGLNISLRGAPDNPTIMTTHNELVSERADPGRSAAIAPDNTSTYYTSLVKIMREVERSQDIFQDHIEQDKLEQAKQILDRNRQLYRNLFKVREIRVGNTPKTAAYDFVNCLNYADDQILSNRIVGIELDPEPDRCFKYLDRFKEAIEGYYFYY